MTEQAPAVPVWTRVDSREWHVTTVKASGAECGYRVVKTRFDDKPRAGQWYAIQDGVEPWWLARGITEAKEEFLLSFHGWRRPFGYADNGQPIYAKDGVRRERAFILAEIGGRGICTGCGHPHAVRTDRSLVTHRTPNRLERCPGARQPAAAEPVHPGVEEWGRITQEGARRG